MQNKKNTKDYKVNIGENIRTWRMLKGIEQKDLASKIDKSITTVSNIETGISIPNMHLVEEIADALEIEVNQLLTNPQHNFTFNNSPQSNGVIYGNNTQQAVDKDLMERVMAVMEKITQYFTTSTKP